MSFKLFLESNSLPLQVVKAFEKLADDQRGAPEQAMVKVQFAMGGGVLNPVVEHTGDLTNRMAQQASRYHPLYDICGDKVDKVLRALNHSYGFENEMQQNIKNNAEYNNVSVVDFTKKLNATLDAYATAHSKLIVYNKAQWLARESAVALGQQNWPRAKSFLTSLQRMMPDESTWTKNAFEYTLDSQGNIVPYK